MEQQEKSFILIGNYVIQKSKQYGLKQVSCRTCQRPAVVYVIQKSKQYGLKQDIKKLRRLMRGCVCHSKK